VVAIDFTRTFEMTEDEGRNLRHEPLPVIPIEERDLQVVAIDFTRTFEMTEDEGRKDRVKSVERTSE